MPQMGTTARLDRRRDLIQNNSVRASSRPETAERTTMYTADGSSYWQAVELMTTMVAQFMPIVEYSFIFLKIPLVISVIRQYYRFIPQIRKGPALEGRPECKPRSVIDLSWSLENGRPQGTAKAGD